MRPTRRSSPRRRQRSFALASRKLALTRRSFATCSPGRTACVLRRSPTISPMRCAASRTPWWRMWPPPIGARRGSTRATWHSRVLSAALELRDRLFDQGPDRRRGDGRRGPLPEPHEGPLILPRPSCECRVRALPVTHATRAMSARLIQLGAARPRSGSAPRPQDLAPAEVDRNGKAPSEPPR